MQMSVKLKKKHKRKQVFFYYIVTYHFQMYNYINNGLINSTTKIIALKTLKIPTLRLLNF